MDNIIQVPTIDAISYARILSQMSNMGDMYFGMGGMYEAPRNILPVILPTKCPCCGRVLATDIIPVVAVNNIKDEKQTDCKVISIYRCTSCNDFFVICSKNYYDSGLFNYEDEDAECSVENIYTYPFDELKTEFEANISKLSPDFIKIYHESELAEKQGLSSICGMGYRRALEFLIRDYCVHFHPDEVDKIDSKPLAKKITDYIIDSDIKCLAERAVWIGNDNTHVINKHPDSTIDDMKAFINVAIAKIHAELVVESAKIIQRK